MNRAFKKAQRLQLKHPDSVIFVIYDYEEGRHDAVTEETLDHLMMIDWDITVLLEFQG